MKPNLVAIAILGSCVVLGASAQAVPCEVEGAVKLTVGVMRSGKVKAIFKPQPAYPKEARANHWTGAGCFLMHVDPKTGSVESVEVLQSIGHKILDEEVIRTLSRWRFAPGAPSSVSFPITFRLDEQE